MKNTFIMANQILKMHNDAQSCLTTRWTIVDILLFTQVHAKRPGTKDWIRQAKSGWFFDRIPELQLSWGTRVIITKHPQIHSPVIRSSLVGYGTVVATSITELNAVNAQGALWQQSVPEGKDGVSGVGVNLNQRDFWILLMILSYGEAIFSPCDCRMSFFFNFTR